MTHTNHLSTDGVNRLQQLLLIWNQRKLELKHEYRGGNWPEPGWPNSSFFRITQGLVTMSLEYLRDMADKITHQHFH